MLYPKLTESRAVIDLSGIWNFQMTDIDSYTEDSAKNPLTSFPSYQTILVTYSKKSWSL